MYAAGLSNSRHTSMVWSSSVSNTVRVEFITEKRVAVYSYRGSMTGEYHEELCNSLSSSNTVTVACGGVMVSSSLSDSKVTVN